MTEILEIWRDEIKSSLEAAQGELASAESEYATAPTATRDAAAQKAAIDKAFAALAPRQLASALAARKRGYAATLDAPAGTLLRIKNQLDGLKRQIADLQQALDQLAILAPPPDDLEPAGELAQEAAE